MEKIVFKLHHKMKELARRMNPHDYVQIQVWEKFRDKINEMVDWINEHEKKSE